MPSNPEPEPSLLYNDIEIVGELDNILKQTNTKMDSINGVLVSEYRPLKAVSPFFSSLKSSLHVQSGLKANRGA